MTIQDKEIQDAIAAGKSIKRRAWGHCEFVKHIKHAHVPSRDAEQFKPEDDLVIDDWEVAE